MKFATWLYSFFRAEEYENNSDLNGQVTDIHFNEQKEVEKTSGDVIPEMIDTTNGDGPGVTPLVEESPEEGEKPVPTWGDLEYRRILLSAGIVPPELAT